MTLVDDLRNAVYFLEAVLRVMILLVIPLVALIAAGFAAAVSLWRERRRVQGYLERRLP